MIIRSPLQKNYGDIVLASAIGAVSLFVLYLITPINVAIMLLLLTPFVSFNGGNSNNKFLYILAILIFLIAAFSEAPKLLLTNGFNTLSIFIIPVGILFIYSFTQKFQKGMIIVGLLSSILISMSGQASSELLDGWISDIDSSPVLDCFVLSTLLVFVSRRVVSQQKDERIERIIFAIIILAHASNYFFSAIAKLYAFKSLNPLHWVYLNDTNLLVQHAVDQNIDILGEYFLMFNSSFAGASTVSLNIFVFTIQLMSLFVLLNRRLCIALLSLYDVMHLGIFLLTGIFFWKWMILNLIFVHFIISDKNHLSFDHYFSDHRFFKFLGIPIASLLFFAALYKSSITVAFLGWHDSPLRYEVSVQIKNPEAEKIYNVPHALLLDYSLPAVQGMLFSSPNNPHPGLKNAGIFGAVSEEKDRSFAYQYCSSEGTDNTVSNLLDPSDPNVYTSQEHIQKISEFISYTLSRLRGPIRENSYFAFLYPHHIFPSYTNIDFALDEVCADASVGKALYGGASIRSVCVGNSRRQSELFSQFSDDNIYEKVCEF